MNAFEHCATFNNALNIAVKFRDQLSETMQSKLDNLLTEQVKVKGCELTQAFVNGFKLATKIMLESFSP